MNLPRLIRNVAITTYQYFPTYTLQVWWRELCEAIESLQVTGTWTPTVTTLSGSLTSYTASGTYTKVGRLVTATALVGITNNGTGATGVVVSLPFTNNSGWDHVGAGREAGLSFAQMQVIVGNGASNAVCLTYNNGYPGGTGASLRFTVTFQVD